MPDKIAFISEGKLKIFDGKRVKAFDSYLDNPKVTNGGACKSYNNGCLIPINISGDNEEYLLVYNFSNGVQYVIKKHGVICDKFGVLADNDIKKISLLSEPNNLEGTIFCQLANCDFNTLNSKFLCKININCTGQFTLTVKGDFGEKSFEISSGISEILCSLISKEFTFSITSSDRKFILNQIQVIYNEKGEI